MPLTCPFTRLFRLPRFALTCWIAALAASMMLHAPAKAAGCSGALQLAGLYGTYGALLTATSNSVAGPAIADALDKLGARDPRDYLARIQFLAPPHDTDEIARSLAGLRDAAQTLQSGDSMPPRDRAKHQTLRANLGQRLIRTGCFKASTSAALLNEDTESGAPSAPHPDPEPRNDPKLQIASDLGPIPLPIKVTAALLGPIALVFGTRLALRSYRISREVRYLLHGRLLLSANGEPDQTLPISIPDFSEGGLKMRRDPEERILAAPGAPVYLHLGETTVPGTIAWSNAFFSGVRFSRRLSRAEVQAVLDRAFEVPLSAGEHNANADAEPI